MGEVKVSRYEERTTRLVFKGPTEVLAEIEEMMQPFGPSEEPLATCAPTGEDELTCHADPGTAADVLKSARRVAMDDIDKVLIRDARNGKFIDGWMAEEGKVVRMRGR